ncbi:NAD(P)-binding domain-containing protein [uncultured Sphingomonas sp.]|uniref:NAD(P)-binding domain-containing protein n=1 Tax=uncultured Sphingomonas sp. TaxID=158754 RepID=UPI0026213953|nr:NAD(P)-binding domain-containing protein [uncultured Sphingomonas sp.]
MTDAVSQQLRPGVVGLGMIGRGVALQLAAAGHDPILFDVRADAADGLDGVTVCAAPAEVARRADVVMIAVIDAKQVRDVLLGDQGLLSIAKPGLVVVILSTLDLAAIHEFAAICAQHGATLVDAGVTQAGQGRLVTMVGGEPATIERIRPVLEAFSKTVVHCGGLGTGMIVKLARNHVTYASWAVIHEAVELATAGGADPAMLLAVLKSATEGGTAPHSRLEAQLTGTRWSDEQVAAVDRLVQKDLAAVQQFAGAAGIETPIADVVRPKMRATLAGEAAPPRADDPWARGIASMARVYAPAVADRLDAAPRTPGLTDTVEHLFGEIWARGHLTMRDRRLLALGVTTMLGRADLLEVQLDGARHQAEFTVDQLREMALFLGYYAGIGNGMTFARQAEAAIAVMTAE